MQSDQTTKESIEFCYRRALQAKDLTAKNLVRLIKLAKFICNKVKESKDPDIKHGKMKIKDLIRKDEGATSVDVSKTELRDFKRVAKRYGVDFAIVKHKTEDKTLYSVFFKAKDQEAINDLINYYTEKRLMKESRPSLMEHLKELKDKVKNAPHKIINRAKERSR